MKKTAFILFASILLLTGLSVSSAPPLTIIENKVDSLINSSLQPGQPGGVVGLISGGELVLRKAYGLADVDHQRANTPETPFNLASVAKQFTAYAMMLLEQQGKIRLDDPVKQYLPRLPDYGHRVSIRQLIHHTSGIGSTDWLRLLSNLPFDQPWSQQQELELIYRYPQLNFPPGQQHLYSNSGYSLLAAIIEKVSGMSYAEYIQQHIFEPLGMNHSYVYTSHGMSIPNSATGYEKTPAGFVAPGAPADASYGGSNIFTSASDLEKWAAHFFSSRIDPGIQSKMFKPSFVLNNGDTISYTFGMQASTYKGLPLVSHSGGDLGYRTQLWVFPQQQLIAYVLLNTDGMNSRNLVVAMVDEYLGDLLQQPLPNTNNRTETEPDAQLLKAYAGTYSLEDGMDLTFEVEDEKLLLLIPGAPKFRVYAHTSEEFFLKDINARVNFVMGPGQQAHEIVWHQSGQKIPGRRISRQPDPQGDQLLEYTGTYMIEGLGVDYPIVMGESGLELLLPPTFARFLNLEKEAMLPLGGDKFLTGRLGVVIHFLRDANGKIIGFNIPRLVRLHHVPFVRK